VVLEGHLIDSIPVSVVRTTPLYSELLGFWTLSIVRYSKKIEEHSVWELGTWICFRAQVRRQETPTQLGPLERASLSHWTALSQSYFTTGGLPPISSSWRRAP
jgi:hypothetical protein